MAKPTPKPTASIEALKQRIARDPLSRAFLQLAEEYRRSGQFEEAIRVCQEGLARHPAYHTARISLGRTYLESGDLENARKTLADVLELAPDWPANSWRRSSAGSGTRRAPSRPTARS
jgi:FimV-like protein